MIYLLENNICIYLIKKKPVSVIDKFNGHSIGDIGISSITAAELFYGVQKSKHRKHNQAALMQFMSPLEIAELGTDVAFSYGQIRAELELKGTLIGSMDTLIAGHALSLGVTLVTNNEREFSRVPKLFIENWVSH